MKQLKLRCPNHKCRLMLMIPEENYGRRVRCASCGHSFIVPIVQTSGRSKPGRIRKAS